MKIRYQCVKCGKKTNRGRRRAVRPGEPIYYSPKGIDEPDSIFVCWSCEKPGVFIPEPL